MRRILCVLLVVFLLVPPVFGEDDGKYVALTFDDGPSGRFTARLLDGLKERQVPATFYLCGYRLESYGELAQRIFDEGHEIGLHGYSHGNMAQMSASQIRKELEDTLALLPQGCHAVTMRPPGGQMTQAVRQVAGEMGLAIVSWSVDPRDWATSSIAQIEERVLSDTDDGDIILLHDMSDSSVEAALDLVDRLVQQGYEFLTVSELAARRDRPMESGACYSQFYP